MSSLAPVPIPAIPVEFSELKDLSLETLEKLESDPLALEEFISKMSIVDNYKKAKEETESKTQDVARSTIVANSKIELTRSEVTALAEKLEVARKQAESSFADRDMLMSKFTPKNLLRDLERIATSADAETEKAIAEFTSVESAKNAILAQRILHHKAKALADLVSSHTSRTNSAISPRSTTKL